MKIDDKRVWIFEYKPRCRIGRFLLPRKQIPKRLTREIDRERTNFVELVGDVQFVVEHRLAQELSVVAVFERMVSVRFGIKPRFDFSDTVH